ncbi:MAG TPA: hypothetical protein VKZ44_01565 [Taishania sp.]|nr:hypothetical protein [Taishania sp.]
MELLHFIFRLGVVFAIFGFIWGLINIGIKLLTIGRQRQTAEIYILKAVQYLLLVDVTFLICYDNVIPSLNYQSQLVFGAIVLAMYFIGKLQNRQNKQMIFKMYTNGMVQTDFGFNLKAEIGVILLALVAFSLFCYEPNWAFNPLSNWFKNSILDIESTPIFGFIFKVIGFFFLVNILMKVINSVMMLLTGQAFQKRNENDESSRNDENRFDDYEEIQ